MSRQAGADEAAQPQTIGQKFNQFLRRARILTSIWALLLLALGIFFFMYPDTAIMVVCRLIAGSLILYGLILILAFILRGARDAGAQNMFTLIIGILIMLIGVYFEIFPDVIVDFAGVMIAVPLFAFALNQFIEMRSLIIFNDPRWFICLISAIITIILGCVVIFAPFTTESFMLQVAGVSLIYTALAGLFINFRVFHYMRKAEKEARKLLEMQKTEIRPAYNGKSDDIIDVDAVVVDAEDKKGDIYGEYGKYTSDEGADSADPALISGFDSDEEGADWAGADAAAPEKRVRPEHAADEEDLFIADEDEDIDF